MFSLFSDVDPCNDTGIVRLSSITYNNNYSDTLGRLEVCYNGYWGTVCDNYQDRITADVACQQLGYDRG